MRRLVTFLTVLSCATAIAQIAEAGGGRPTASDFDMVLADPSNEATFQDFLQKFPKFEIDDDGATRTFYVAEGDLFLTEKQMRAYIYSHASGAAPVRTGSGELLVLIEKGKPVYWSKGQRQLSYSVDRKTFLSAEQYELVAKNMGLAASDWVAACPDCGISFTYKKEFDSAPDRNKVTFIVKYAPDADEFIAASFFPNDPAFKHNLLIGPQYFTTTFDKVGVLRHETGHILGYRHEQNVGVPGCYVEDNKWKPLTPYDPHSVMHYFCGGGGSMDLKITDIDREGHRTLYR